MGKGRGGSGTFFICFYPGNPVFKFKERCFFFFLRFYLFLRKSFSAFFYFLFYTGLPG
jgi:hypothetical protein